MEKYFNGISVIVGVIGGTFCGFMGGWDMLLKAITILVVLDYVTGIIKAIYEKTLSSGIGFKGILKKITIFIVIATAYVIQQLIGENIPLREITITFFIANEGISLIENASVLVPIPDKLRDILLQLRDRAESESEKNE